MVVRQAVSYAVRRACGMVVHPRRTAGELASDAGQVVTAGVGMAGHVVGSVARHHQSSSETAAAPVVVPEAKPEVAPEDLVERPGPVPEEVLATAATPAPKPAPPKKRPTARKVGEEIKTPSGITAAGPGFNPATGETTDLVQPGTEPLMDPSLTKSVAAEAKMMKKASSVRK